jgi:phosphoribosyl 1,2-cyclic phosphate phosphodiesterase
LTQAAAAGTRRLTFLGTGTSTGVPMIGCDCQVCTSNDPRNERTRPSVLLSFPGGNLLVDTTPEMRIQLLREHVRLIHAIAFTHSHADHLFGLDDARLFPRRIGGPVPIYCEFETEQTIRRVFSYAFRPEVEQPPGGFVPKLNFVTIEPGVPVQILGETVLPIRLEHGPSPILGFRAGSLAYCTDVSKVPDRSLPMLEGLDILILDALRHEPHPTHMSLGEALALVELLKPGQTFLTHLSHSFDHGPTQARLPPNVALAYDGLQLTF